MASSDLREELNCSICLNIYSEPVTLKCGHNFCLACIKSVLTTQKGSGAYSCPECRAEFRERPALQRNMKLSNIAERFRSTRSTQSKKTGIFCTYCIHSPAPAIKSCLLCEAYLCDNHVMVHSKSPEHVLTDPTTSLCNRKCSVHKEVLKYYCPEDAVCICVSCCVLGEHRGHQVELLNEATEKKKRRLRNILENLTSKQEQAHKRIQNLQEHRRDVQDKAAVVSDQVTDFFTDIREQLDVLEKRVLCEISKQEEQVLLHVSDLIQQLEIKKEELMGKMHQIEMLCNITDPLTVLQGRESDYNEHKYHKDRERDDRDMAAVGDLDDVLISVTLNRALADIVSDAERKRGLFIQEARDILLDINTAHSNIAVSSDLKSLSRSDRKQSHRPARGRFKFYFQILSIRSFSTGQSYWEVETSQTGGWKIGVAFPSIEKKGDQSWLGNNKKSWCLYKYNKEFSVIHNSNINPLTIEAHCQRIGIFLDYEAGRLSFYVLSEPIKHLHTFTSTFTEPLYAAFYVRDSGWVRIMS
ncbi:E3 ubiquitin/ISG15 ligase TRIM25 [Xenopus laevis]|uniref:E3 ubiquitin/ISG15 ligase TRIM25 n=2 Tax=Xenopus laevis TaxID=8355 RepID=A0A1L8ENT7_XENLA|nr:E3 ubiquitin/ISG15 ligase TRIM25 [Xenopus laevis]OCT60985.1 hypothetical protein XELAEV_18047011mg [Xenopus laevis]